MSSLPQHNPQLPDKLKLIDVVQWGVRNLSHEPQEGTSLLIKGTLENQRVYFSMLHPVAFSKLRTHLGVEPQQFRDTVGHANSLSGGSKAVTSKSGSKFWYTADGRFIIKGISKQEANCIKQFIPAYVDHVSTHPHCLINKVLAAYHAKLGGNSKYFIVVSNVFRPSDTVTGIFDLKGTTEDRLVKEKTLKATNVGKDLNFKDMAIMLSSAEDVEILHSAVEKDSEFLRQHRIIDYSLLVGIVTTDKNTNKQTTTSAPPQPTTDLDSNSTTTTNNNNNDDALQAHPTISENAPATTDQTIPKPRAPPPQRPLEDHRRLSWVGLRNKSQQRKKKTPAPKRASNTTESTVDTNTNTNPNAENGADPDGTEVAGTEVTYRIAIIDFLQPWTNKKRAAHAFKAITLKIRHEIDTEPPNYYSRRFVRKINEKIVVASED